jgi:CubicO group peptidase (beta-lactamase class C family)
MSRRTSVVTVTVIASLGLLVVPWDAPAERVGERRSASNATPGSERVARAAPATTKGRGGLPITGKAVEVLAPLDEAIEKIMLRHGIPGASVAITKDGKLVFARGFGWGHYEKTELVTPTTPFGLASVSKCLTALAILKLVEEGKLKLDDKAFDVLKDIKPPPRVFVDQRIYQITIRQLLNHSGGWDRDKSGDPINWSFQVSQTLQVPMPITEDHLSSYMLGVGLDFDPGTDAKYSNFGYILLGLVAAKASGQSYEECVRSRVLKPMGMTGARMHDREGKYYEGEARRYNPGLMQAMPPYNLPWSDASGGWAASSVDLARMMTALDGSRGGKPFLKEETMKEMVAPPPEPLKPRDDGSYFGLGWDTVAKTPKGFGYTKGGCWPGVRANVKHRVDGIDTVVLYNAVVQMDPLDMRIANDAARQVHDAVARIKEWPKIDLFDEYR